MPRLTLPLPPNELRVNRVQGVHWAVAGSLKSRYRMEVKKAAREQEREWRVTEPPTYPVTLTATFFLGKRMRCDESDCGAWLKTGLDQLVRMGIWPDDGSKYIHFVPRVDRDWDRPRVELQW